MGSEPQCNTRGTRPPEAEGLITRVQGAGTFVTGAKLRQSIDRLEGLAESLAGHQLTVQNTVLSVRESTATPLVAAKLAVPEGSPILFVERLRSVANVPLSLDTTSLRPEAIELSRTQTWATRTSSVYWKASGGFGSARPRILSKRSPPIVAQPDIWMSVLAVRYYYSVDSVSSKTALRSTWSPFATAGTVCPWFRSTRAVGPPTPTAPDRQSDPPSIRPDIHADAMNSVIDVSPPQKKGTRYTHVRITSEATEHRLLPR